MIIRRAVPADRDDLLCWRNDPATRAMARSSDPVSADEHARWFEAVLFDPQRHLFIGEEPGFKVGMCRFDREPGTRLIEVSINLNPLARGRGLSAQLLATAVAALPAPDALRLRATIRRDNLPSIRCFLRCGFVLAGREGDFEVYLRETVPPPKR